MMWLRIARWSAAIGIAVLATGCAEPITQIYVCYSLDDQVEGMAPTVHAEIVSLGAGEVIFDSQLSLGLGSSLLTQSIVQGEAERVRVTLRATIDQPVGPSAEFSQSAEVAFQAEKALDLFLRLESSCTGRTCAEGETCVEGDCEDIAISPGCIMEHGGEPSGRACDARATTACPESR